MDDRIKDIVGCSICTDLVNDPRMLPCIHTFCLSCLSETSVNIYLSPGDSMPCPLCRTPFTIPSEGIVGLPKNFIMERLVEIARMTSHSSGSTSTSLISPEIEDAIRNFGVQQCISHRNQLAKLYCFNCEQVICQRCSVESHRAHNYSGVDEAVEGFRAQIDNDLEETRRLSEDAAKQLDRIIEEQEKFKSLVENAASAITKRGNELKELIDTCTQNLLDELTSIQMERSQQLETDQEEIESHQATIQSFESYLSQLSSRGSPAEICRNAKELHQRSVDLKESLSIYINQQVPACQVVFEESTFENLSTWNIVGFVKVNSPMTLEARRQGRREVRANPTTRLQGRREMQVSINLQSNAHLENPSFSKSKVRGVTKLNKRIYVLCCDPNLILVFDHQTQFRNKQNIKIENIFRPFDLASSKKSNCLYISENSSRSRSINLIIWKMKTDNHSLERIVSIYQVMESPLTLSVSSEDHLLICMTRCRQGELVLYDTDGKSLQQCELHEQIKKPFHCIQKPSKEFIIAHGVEHPAKWKISLVSRDGKNIIHQFDPEVNMFRSIVSIYLSPDYNSNRLFIADTYNHRVILFDLTSFNSTQLLLTKEKDEIYYPFKIMYNSQKQQLLIASGKSDQQLNVYKVD